MGVTELSARKQAVLAAVVKTYIETGEPIGSRILTELIENAPSSATLRNEMNELCALGLLKQPHTSAGRVPTNDGYRLYVSSLMKPSVLDDATKRYIDTRLNVTGCDPRVLPRLAADVICEITGLSSIYCDFADERVYLKSAQLLPTGRRAAVLLIVTSDGRALSRACRIQSGFSEQLSIEFERIFNRKLKRRPISRFTKADLQGIVATAAIDAFELTPVVALLFDMVSEVSDETLSIRGSNELYKTCGEADARRILSLAQKGEPLLSVIRSVRNDTEVVFGNDTGLTGLSRTALVISKYFSGNRYCGSIGVIGTARMSYDLIIPSIQYTASRLSEMMAEAAKDLED